MPHGYAVVHGYGVEFGCVASQLLDFGFHCLAYVVQMCVAGYKLRKRVYYSYHRLAHLFWFHAVGQPQGSGSGHAASLCCGVTAQRYNHKEICTCVEYICCKIIFYDNIRQIIAQKTDNVQSKMADLLKIFYSKQRGWTIFVSISLYLALCRFYLVDSRIFSIFVTVNRQRYEMC